MVSAKWKCKLNVGIQSCICTCIVSCVENTRDHTECAGHPFYFIEGYGLRYTTRVVNDDW